MENDRLTVWTQVTKIHEKYVYYVIALCVTSIGYSVFITNGLPLTITLFPLGVSILCWGISIYSGIKSIHFSISILKSNMEILNITYNIRNYGETENQILLKELRESIDSQNDKSTLAFNWQYRLFYLGIIFFVIWRIIEMAIL